MIIVIDAQANQEERAALLALVEQAAGHRRPVAATCIGESEVIAIDHAVIDAQMLEAIRRQPAVAQILTLNTPYQLVSRHFKASPSRIVVGDPRHCEPVTIGGEQAVPVIMAGPCAVESREQLLETARAVKEAGATVLRGGAFKPRTSPYQFQGLGIEGLQLLAEAREETGLPIITEVMEPEMVEVVADYADILQIGARNMQNFPLLQAVGRRGRGKPVMLKRGLSATIDEWLLAAEYIVAAGNPNVILCERGVRSFDPQTRNLLDLACVPLLHELTHLPVIVDPSHATGRRELVPTMARAGIAAGAEGLILEVHPDPNSALCDGRQSITPAELHTIVYEARLMVQIMHGADRLSQVA
uniref:3-deoxy-7-phosphoheptulonate synthase n=1 Tax=Thermogemmatispora argillosa TaxID=2045280 RepID=A0A455T6R6_9CHLR|nr:3-deoxy-7-phosphoheptulonate synthase [Thermogemmatispora argillosa]